MDARKLLSTSTLDSEVVGLMRNAFDRAWTEVGTYFMGSEVGDARTILAKAILGNAFDCHDMDELRRLAIRALIFHYPWLAESSGFFQEPTDDRLAEIGFAGATPRIALSDDPEHSSSTILNFEKHAPKPTPEAVLAGQFSKALH
jgi:hypothetical protein